MDIGHEKNKHNSSSPDYNNELLPSMSPDKLEFYKTYDVMTGVRIAATLGGFFSLMVLLVVYKSKCKSRSVSEEDLAAVAAAVVEEEERKETERRLSLYGGGRIQTSIKGRASLAQGPPFTYHPPLPVGVYTRHHSLTPSPPLVIYNQEEEDEIPEVWRSVTGKRPSMQHLLRVPSSRRSSRRLSSVTCSSCDSSYFERRGSALEVGHPIPPPFVNTSNSDKLDEEPWDYYYPIDIQVIQPTPQVSPCSSQATLYGGRGIGEVLMGDSSWRPTNLSVSHLTPPAQHRPSGMAPLAVHDTRSESLNLSTSPHYSSTDRQSSPQPTDQERSLGSDSVFLDEELVDTEDEVDGFSTDSESGSSPIVSTGSSHTVGSKIPSRPVGEIPRSSDPQPLSHLTSHHPLVRHRLQVQSPSLQQNQRRYSSPSGLQSTTDYGDESTDCRRASSITMVQTIVITGNKSKKTSSDSDTLLATPVLCNLPTSSKEARSFMSISCDRLVESLQRSRSDHKDPVQHCAWSQETLF